MDPELAPTVDHCAEHALASALMPLRSVCAGDEFQPHSCVNLGWSDGACIRRSRASGMHLGRVPDGVPLRFPHDPVIHRIRHRALGLRGLA